MMRSSSLSKSEGDGKRIIIYGLVAQLVRRKSRAFAF